MTASPPDPAAFWQRIDDDLEVSREGDSRLVAAFTEAGFTDEEARRGTKLLESGRYFGFADVATTLRPSGLWGKTGMHPAMESAVQRIAARVDPHLTTSAWGQTRLSETAETYGPELVYLCEGRVISRVEAEQLGYGTAKGPSREITTYRKADGQ